MDPGVLVVSLVVLLFSLTVHEAAHAWAANRLGDSTARQLGRLSLNPVVHIDPVGTLLLPALAIATGAPLIGWAKPVPVNTSRLRRLPRDYMLVAAAGPASNILIAIVASLALRLVPVAPVGLGGIAVTEPTFALVTTALQLNLLLAVFNLVPVPPLDGGNILGGMLRGRLSERYEAIRPWGVFILYALMLSGALRYIIAPPYALLARLLTL